MRGGRGTSPRARASGEVKAAVAAAAESSDDDGDDEEEDGDEEDEAAEEDGDEEEDEDDSGEGDDDDGEELEDFELIYPARRSSALETSYNDLLEQARNSQCEWVTRLRAPLQQRKGQAIDMEGGTAALPAKATRQEYGRDCFGHFFTDRRGFGPGDAKKPISKPSEAQVEKAMRLMAGHSSTSTREVARTAPAVFKPGGMRAGAAARDGAAWGMRYRKMKQERAKLPTLAVNTVTIGGFGGFGTESVPAPGPVAGPGAEPGSGAGQRLLLGHAKPQPQGMGAAQLELGGGFGPGPGVGLGLGIDARRHESREYMY